VQFLKVLTYVHSALPEVLFKTCFDLSGSFELNGA